MTEDVGDVAERVVLHVEPRIDRHVHMPLGDILAVMGLYTRGGTVFTCGSTDWAHGLRGNDPHVTRITKNLLDRLSK